MDQRVKDEVLATYAAFAKAFLANVIKAIDKLMQYPIAYIGDGRTTLVDSYPVKPAELMASKQWHSTNDLSYEVMFASADKAHLVLRSATSVRSDGSPIETVSAFYAFTRTTAGWPLLLSASRCHQLNSGSDSNSARVQALMTAFG